jgi:hypothetical protein
LRALANSLLWTGENKSDDENFHLYDVATCCIPLMWGFDSYSFDVDCSTLETTPIYFAEKILLPWTYDDGPGMYFMITANTNELYSFVNHLVEKSFEVYKVI